MLSYSTVLEAEAVVGTPLTALEALWLRYSSAMPDPLLYFHNIAFLLLVFSFAPLALLELRRSPLLSRHKLQPKVSLPSSSFLRCYLDVLHVFFFAVGPLQLLSYPAVKDMSAKDQDEVPQKNLTIEGVPNAEDNDFFVGQEFADVKAFRKAIKDAAIAQHFELKIIKSDLIRYFAKCAKEDCPWRIRAVKLPNSSVFTIRSFDGMHTCGKDAQQGHHQASIDWIVNFIEERLRDNANYKPRDILQDVKNQYGITIPYKQAWRAKERGLANIYGSSEEGYCLLPALCRQIKHSNPGSIAEVYTSGSHFQRLFISVNASIDGFIHGCLPVICIGAFPLQSKYLGSLLSVTSFDADGGLFLVAFGIVDAETDESWMWFLSEFHQLLETNLDEIPLLTILSNGQKGIAESVKRKFPSSHHAICMNHFSEAVAKEFKNPRLVQLLWKAALSTTTVGFREKISEIEEICEDAAKWIREIFPPRWASAYFAGSRFGHLAANTQEFHSWVLEVRELPIIQVVECIHGKLIDVFKERKEKCMAWTTVLSPSAQKRIDEALARADSYRVIRSDQYEFEVLSGDRANIVNIGTRSCSCRDWHLYGIPCSHAIASILSSKKNIYDYADQRLTVASYVKAYSCAIHPIPSRTEWNKKMEGCAENDCPVVRPPKSRRPPGRPEKKRVCPDEANREKHIVHCSRCNQTGHYKRTCKAEISIGWKD